MSITKEIIGTYQIKNYDELHKVIFANKRNTMYDRVTEYEKSLMDTLRQFEYQQIELTKIISNIELCKANNETELEIATKHHYSNYEQTIVKINWLKEWVLKDQLGIDVPFRDDLKHLFEK